MLVEAAMIELTEQQVTALGTPQGDPPRVINPRTKETFVLLRAEEYERLKEHGYDDSPWTRDELQALAWQAGEQTEWEEYGGAAEKP
jgi:alpha-D-ribose 1-methylphosphonate 5-phosphate C-P lyase